MSLFVAYFVFNVYFQKNKRLIHILQAVLFQDDFDLSQFSETAAEDIQKLETVSPRQYQV